MNRAIILFLLLSSCAKERKHDPVSLTTDVDLETSYYEGRIPLDDRHNIFFEISLRPSTTANEGDFTLKEFVEENELPSMMFETKGMYSMMENDEGLQTIFLQNSARSEKLLRVYKAPNGKIRQESFRNKDLTLQKKNENVLIVLNNDSKPVSLEYQHNLFKRVSDLFTVEGYFREKDDTAEFSEMNTRINWPVMKVGDYANATKQYYELTSKKGEPVYLKGIGYNVLCPSAGNHTAKALVFKRIIQTTGVVIPN
jgi:hypothetical protein